MVGGDKSAHVLDKSITSPPERVLYRPIWPQYFVHVHNRLLRDIAGVIIVLPLERREILGESLCEAPGCSFPGTICPACAQCLCSQHLRSSSCETCQGLLAHRSFEQRLSRRFLGSGLIVMLCALLLLLPSNDAAGGITISLIVLLLIAGFMLLWLGWLVRS